MALIGRLLNGQAWIDGLRTYCGCSSMVEPVVANYGVVGSIPTTRSRRGNEEDIGS